MTPDLDPFHPSRTIPLGPRLALATLELIAGLRRQADLLESAAVVLGQMLQHLQRDEIVAVLDVQTALEDQLHAVDALTASLATLLTSITAGVELNVRAAVPLLPAAARRDLIPTMRNLEQATRSLSNRSLGTDVLDPDDLAVVGMVLCSALSTVEGVLRLLRG